MKFALVAGTRIEPMGEQWAAYSAVSGETLLLNTEAAAILEWLSERPMDEAAIAQALAAETGDDASTIAAALRHTWDQLLSAGLVRALAGDDHNSG